MQNAMAIQAILKKVLNIQTSNGQSYTNFEASLFWYQLRFPIESICGQH